MKLAPVDEGGMNERGIGDDRCSLLGRWRITQPAFEAFLLPWSSTSSLFLSPLAFALGTVLQQRGTLETHRPEGELPFSAQVVRKPVWFLGIFITVVGFVLQAAALHGGSLSLVQALQALSLVFALPLGVRLSNQRVGRRSIVGAGITVAGLIVFVVLGQPQGGISEPGATAWASLPARVIVVATALLTWQARRRRGPASAALFATAAGVCFALQAGVTKVFVSALGDGIAALLSTWSLYALIVAAGVGFILEQASLKTGSLAPAMAALNAATLAVSVLIAVTVFLSRLNWWIGKWQEPQSWH